RVGTMDEAVRERAIRRRDSTPRHPSVAEDARTGREQPPPDEVVAGLGDPSLHHEEDRVRVAGIRADRGPRLVPVDDLGNEVVVDANRAEPVEGREGHGVVLRDAPPLLRADLEDRPARSEDERRVGAPGGAELVLREQAVAAPAGPVAHPRASQPRRSVGPQQRAELRRRPAKLACCMSGAREAGALEGASGTHARHRAGPITNHPSALTASVTHSLYEW